MDKIKIYASPTCPHCKAAKEFLREHNVEFEDFDVTSSEEKLNEMKEKSGQIGVPVIDTGSAVIVGFQENKLREALGL